MIVFHLLFAAVSAAVLALMHPPLLGWGILFLVTVYNLVLPVLARRDGDWRLYDLWIFLLPLSIFQVMPDWLLSQLLGTLSFPNLGGPRIGTVPLYMAGMWVIPLSWVVMAGQASREVLGRTGEWLGAGLAALLILGAAEWAARPLALWRAQHVSQHLGVAHYVLLPEALLGIACAIAFRATRERGVLDRLVAAFAVMVFYTGALVLSYFLFERAG
jgi:hypothetical protein